MEYDIFMTIQDASGGGGSSSPSEELTQGLWPYYIAIACLSFLILVMLIAVAWCSIWVRRRKEETIAGSSLTVPWLSSNS